MARERPLLTNTSADTPDLNQDMVRGRPLLLDRTVTDHTVKTKRHRPHVNLNICPLLAYTTVALHTARTRNSLRTR